jgi:hypothetical protein
MLGQEPMLGGYKMIRQKLFSGKGLAWLGLAQAGSALLRSFTRKNFSVGMCDYP